MLVSITGAVCERQLRAAIGIIVAETLSQQRSNVGFRGCERAESVEVDCSHRADRHGKPRSVGWLQVDPL
jgi:hypothetical protein